MEEYAPALKQELRSMRKPLGDTTRRLKYASDGVDLEMSDPGARLALEAVNDAPPAIGHANDTHVDAYDGPHPRHSGYERSCGRG